MATVLSLSLCLAASAGAAVLLQQDASYLAFEAEDLSSRTGPSTVYEVITTTSNTSKQLPEGTNAAGAALYHNTGTGTASYTLQFTADGDYYLYTRYSMYNRVTTAPDSYGNEDSIFTPAAFNVASPGDVQHLNPWGRHPATNPNEGMYFYWDEANTNGTSTPQLFTISGASVETPVEVTFTVGTRESGVALDRFAFVNSSQILSQGDSAYLNSLVSAPEPGRALLLAFGLAALFARRRRPLPSVRP